MPATMRRAIGSLVVAAALALGQASAEPVASPPLFTNQRYVEEMRASPRFDIKDTMAVFAHVLNALPERVVVYPTENYYYFRFVERGVPYGGNMRFDPQDRDEGKLHFGYYEDHAAWKADGYENAVVVDAKDGVDLDRVDALTYRITYRGKTVTFALNDVSAIKPPSTLLGPDERYIGAVFDESAMRFFLVFNEKLRIFHYLLDETETVPEAFAKAARSKSILIGKRTGFAFFDDQRFDRKILIGAFEPNVENNTYFDGPFDQLPENFIEGNVLRDAIIASDPTVRGEIDRLGHFSDGTGRYAIQPYMVYRRPADLLIFESCVSNRRVPAASYYRCFVIEPVLPGRGVGVPLALRNLRGAK